MYTIKCDDYFLHNATLGILVSNAKCKLEINKTGSLTFYVAPNHPYRDKIKKLTSKITLYQDDEALFYGRVLNNEIDIDRMMSVECEGELSELLDTIHRPQESYPLITGDRIKDFLQYSIDEHNKQVTEDKQFTLGTVTVTDQNYTLDMHSYERTLDVLNNNLIKRIGGFIRIRHTVAGDKRYIDYLKEPDQSSQQKIEFGKNIVDVTQTISGENIYTALIPLGAKITDDSSSENEKRLTIKSLEDSTEGTIVKTSDYIYDSEAVEKWGWIWKVEKWDDITNAPYLLTRAKEKLSQNVFESMYLELTAIYLHSINVDIDIFRVGDEVHCVSTPHNIDARMVVKSITIDVDNPANTVVKLVQAIDTPSAEKSLTSNTDEDSKKINDLNTSVKEYTPSQTEFDNQITELKNWTDNNYTPRSSLSNYPTKTELDDEISNLKTWTGNNYASKTDLSEYAKIADVNTAFSELATAIEGV